MPVVPAACPVTAGLRTPPAGGTGDAERPDEVPPDSEYVDLMPRLYAYAELDPADPRRGALRDELVLGFLPVARHLAKKHGRGYPGGLDDLVQVATVGLIAAIDRWDPERAQGEFLGYLIPCVRGEILRYFRDRTWSMRVPRRLKELGVAIRRATGPLSQQLGRAPKPSELAAHLGAGVEEVIEALDAQANQSAGSLDAVAGDEEGDTPLADRLGELDRELDLVEYRDALRPLLDRLPERERTILMLRFFGEMTQTQIAERVGISQMHVSRLLSRTLAELRRGLLDDRPPAAEPPADPAGPTGPSGPAGPVSRARVPRPVPAPRSRPGAAPAAPPTGRGRTAPG
ncbi:SigB/SigF/SigG family RNA polymerase sigma factor [Pseudonocardia kujensis]|uniref:SigB/SigF/SigG family RNA polymerase sigma factor n=1 Tax=Pseudonocardia kujensis TaxID=1128675 RepID=UPI001E401570|nr:SigB/SigF/SigG family RNA polymerase sigma factor [Pseudonocardia kujensis]MCE0763830.1 SigB/SigF/SigG family RNA polymerase sigma factor [Pseudonocardia kujensis]